MAQLKNLIVNGASRFLTPIKGDLSGTSDYSLKMKTYKQGSSTETYGTSYPLWAQWETNTVLKLLCTGYSTKVDMANTLATARTIRTNLASTSTASFDGSANITPGVTGTLPVGNGGTGATTFTSTAALVGNGTSAISASNLKISNYEATLVSSGTDATRYVATNSYGSVSLWASENRGVYDHTNSKWIIASKQDSSKTYVPRWASIGGAAKPVYFDSDGSAAACSSTVGSGTKPVYMSSGTITASSSTVGGAAKPIYMSSGTITACSSTVGSTDTPVYMNAGTITTTGKKFSDYVTLTTAQTISGQKTFSSRILGRLQADGISSSWYNGRDNALVIQKTANGYSPIMSMKSTNGSWEVGHYNASGYHDIFMINYKDDTEYTAATPNSVLQALKITKEGQLTAVKNIVSSSGNMDLLTTGRGYFLTDLAGQSYPGVYDNGSNLWIGATQTAATHHRGQTYISAGYNGSAGNPTAFISVPNSTNTNGANYGIFHTGYLDVSKATAGTLSVSRGGTGKTTGNAAANYFINELTTGSSNPTDADYYVCQYAGGGTSTTTYHRRPHSALYNYIVGKADSRYAKATHYHSLLYPGGDSTKVGVRAVWVSDSNAYFFRPMSESQDRSPKYHLGSSSYRWDSAYMQGTLYIVDQMGEYINGKISGQPNADLGKITACDDVTVDGTVTAWKLKATDSKIQCQPTYDGTTTYATNVYVGTSGLFSRTTNTSSRTIKNSIDILKEPFLLAENLYNLPIHQFKYNDFIITDTTDQRYGKLLPGFIIEEMDEIYPVAVDKPVEDVKQWSWNAQYLIPPMLKLIQDQKKQLDKHQEEIDELKELVHKLLDKLN